MFGIQIPTGEGNQQKVKPDWAIVLAYEQKLRKEAMKRVLEGHTLAEAMVSVTKDADLKEAYFTTPVALKSAVSDGHGHPNKLLAVNKIDSALNWPNRKKIISKKKYLGHEVHTLNKSK